MRILLIEDDEAINQAIALTLKKEGYAIDAFTDAEKGLRYASLNAADYDLMIFDVMMPGISGIEICKKLRDNKISVPIMMLTALSSPKDKVLALDSGADDYLTKPFSVEELMARIRALLRRPKAVLPSKIALGPLTLISADKKLMHNETEIYLTLKEFRILEYMMTNPNQVLTRDQLLDHVWDSGFSSMSNTIEVHINSLRKKLRNYGLDSLIETVRGLGYKLSPQAEA